MQTSTIIKLAITAAVVLGGLGLLVMQGSASSDPYRMVDQAMAEPGRWSDHKMRIHGWVEPGTIITRVENQQTRRTFVLASKGKQLRVTHQGPAPDTFKDASEVVATGKMVKLPDGTFAFEATELSAKCPSRYEGAESNKKIGERPTFSGP